MIAIGANGGLIFAMVTVFKKNWAPITAPIYAVLEGLALGSISAMYEVRFAGLPMQAVGLTFGVLVALLLVYRTGIIRATDKFRMGVVAATGGTSPSICSPGFSASSASASHLSSIVIVAALNLVLDFIESGARAGAPKCMEWYGAFGLMVTLIWLYLEILRLLSKLRTRD